MSHQRQPIRKLGRWVLAIAIGTSASLVLVITVLAFQSDPTAIHIPSKQQVLQQMLSDQATAEARLPRIVKSPQPQPTAPASCPGPAPSTMIIPGDNGQFKQQSIVNSVGAVPVENVPYYVLIFSGARGSNPQQGLIIVERLPKDLCAPGFQTNQLLYFDTPYQRGALTITRVSGDIVTFTTAVGPTGTFNFMTGKFS